MKRWMKGLGVAFAAGFISSAAGHLSDPSHPIGKHDLGTFAAGGLTGIVTYMMNPPRDSKRTRKEDQEDQDQKDQESNGQN